MGPPDGLPTRFHSSKTTLGAAVEAFFADRDLAPATRRAYRAAYGSLIQAFGTEMPVTALMQTVGRGRLSHCRSLEACGAGEVDPARASLDAAPVVGAATACFVAGGVDGVVIARPLR